MIKNILLETIEPAGLGVPLTRPFYYKGQILTLKKCQNTEFNGIYDREGLLKNSTLRHLTNASIQLARKIGDEYVGDSLYSNITYFPQYNGEDVGVWIDSNTFKILNNKLPINNSYELPFAFNLIAYKDFYFDFNINEVEDLDTICLIISNYKNYESPNKWILILVSVEDGIVYYDFGRGVEKKIPDIIPARLAVVGDGKTNTIQIVYEDQSGVHLIDTIPQRIEPDKPLHATGCAFGLYFSLRRGDNDRQYTINIGGDITLVSPLYVVSNNAISMMTEAVAYSLGIPDSDELILCCSKESNNEYHRFYLYKPDGTTVLCTFMDTASGLTIRDADYNNGILAIRYSDSVAEYLWICDLANGYAYTIKNPRNSKAIIYKSIFGILPGSANLGDSIAKNRIYNSLILNDIPDNALWEFNSDDKLINVCNGYVYENADDKVFITNIYGTTAYLKNTEGRGTKASVASMNNDTFLITDYKDKSLSAVYKVNEVKFLSSYGRIPGQDGWVSKANMLTARYGAGAVTINNLVYVVGGSDGSSELGTIEVYNPDNDSWSNISASMTIPRKNFGIAAFNGYIYIFGGYGWNDYTRSCERYNMSSGLWEWMSQLHYAREGIAGVVANGYMYAIGGYNSGSGYFNTVERGDSFGWTQLSPMPIYVGYCCAAAVTEGDHEVIYIFGGKNSNGVLNSVYKYDPVNGSWAQVQSPMPTARYKAAAAVVDGKIYVIGGYDDTGPLDVVEVFDPSNSTWTTKTSMPTARYSAVASTVTINNETVVHVIGGYDGSSVLKTNERYTLSGGGTGEPVFYWNPGYKVNVNELKKDTPITIVKLDDNGDKEYINSTVGDIVKDDNDNVIGFKVTNITASSDPAWVFFYNNKNIIPYSDIDLSWMYVRIYPIILNKKDLLLYNEDYICITDLKKFDLFYNFKSIPITSNIGKMTGAEAHNVSDHSAQDITFVRFGMDSSYIEIPYPFHLKDLRLEFVMRINEVPPVGEKRAIVSIRSSILNNGLELYLYNNNGESQIRITKNFNDYEIIFANIKAGDYIPIVIRNGSIKRQDGVFYKLDGTAIPLSPKINKLTLGSRFSDDIKSAKMDILFGSLCVENVPAVTMPDVLRNKINGTSDPRLFEEICTLGNKTLFFNYVNETLSKFIVFDNNGKVLYTSSDIVNGNSYSSFVFISDNQNYAFLCRNKSNKKMYRLIINEQFDDLYENNPTPTEYEKFIAEQDILDGQGLSLGELKRRLFKICSTSDDPYVATRCVLMYAFKEFDFLFSPYINKDTILRTRIQSIVEDPDISEIESLYTRFITSRYNQMHTAIEDHISRLNPPKTTLSIMCAFLVWRFVYEFNRRSRNQA